MSIYTVFGSLYDLPHSQLLVVDEGKQLDKEIHNKHDSRSDTHNTIHVEVYGLGEEYLSHKEHWEHGESLENIVMK